MRLDLEVNGTQLDTSHDSLEPLASGQDALIYHDQEITLGNIRLGVEYGLADNIGLELSLPFRVAQTEIVYRDEAGQVVEPLNPDIHHRNQTLTGLADPEMRLSQGHNFGSWLFKVSAGASIPIGRTEPDPFAAGDAGITHEHFQFGTGRAAFLAGSSLGRDFGRVSMGTWVGTAQSLATNNHGYLPGDRYYGGATVGVPVWARRITLIAGAHAQRETAERWNGEIPEEEGNAGRTDLLGLLGATWKVAGGYELTPLINIPIYTDIVGGQLSYPLIASIRIGISFGEHRHDHGEQDGEAHEDEHRSSSPDDAIENHDTSANSVDILVLTDNGSAVDLQPVPNKITVFDFWATWCAPCIELDRQLRGLAAAHPEKLAIRKINVVDWNTPAAKQHLTKGGFGLPHVKVFNASGALAIERSGATEDLILDIETLLKGPSTP